MKNTSKYFCGIILLFISVFVLTSCDKKIDEIDKKSITNNETEVIESVYPPMVMVDGRLFKDMGYVNSAIKCDTADGKILTSVDVTKTPQKDNESNFGEGYEYQMLDQSHINVKINDKWYIFQNIAISSRQIPNSVANFKATVNEVTDDRLLVTVIDIPENFNWIFQSKEIEQIKPISLTIDNLMLKGNKKEVTTENLKDKIVEVWFDGSIKNNEVEMSYPIELENIYRILVVE